MIKPWRVLRGRFRKEDVSVSVGTVTPWWVNILTDWGRPVVAAVVLTMCAPGEHYIAHTAGWSERLAWGMPFVLTAYAGISAVVATKRPKGSPGKRTAVWGAILSILLAMTAQPIAHLYQRGLIHGHQFALTIIASCVPALVLGHLLHLAVSHVLTRTSPAAVLPEDKPEDTHKDTPVPAWVTEEKARRAVPEDKGTRWLFEDKTYRAGVPEDTTAGDMARAATDVLRTRTGQDTPSVPVTLEDEDTASRVSLRKEDKDTGAGDDLSSRRKLTDVIKDIRQEVGDDPDAIKDRVLATSGFEDMRSTPQKRNTLNTAVRRALRKSA